MSDLQTGLVVLGVLAIVIVLALNWWQDRRARRQVMSRFPDSGKDPLLQGSNTALPGNLSEPIVRREPGFSAVGTAEAEVAEGAELAAVEGTVPHDPEEADEACETVIDVTFLEAVVGEDLAAFTQGIRHAGQKPLRVFAETVDGVHRSVIRQHEKYASVQVAVLLANRSGALSSGEWAEALSRARVLADRFEGTVEATDTQAVLQRAASLDSASAALDAQVGLTLVARNRRWSPADVLAAARDAGFAGLHEGRLPFADERGAVRFTLGRSDGVSLGSAGPGAIAQLALVLDVPRAPADADNFSRMTQVARGLATTLDAGLVDDNGRELGDGAEAAIDKQLHALYARLEQAGFEPGSARALRIFG